MKTNWRYYWNLFKRVAVISTSNMLIHRSNVITLFIFESLFLLANLAGLAMGVQFAGGQIGGWTLDQVFFVAMLFQVGHQLFTTFFLSGIFHVAYFTWTGRMDFVLLKPLHPLLGLIACTEFIISNIPNLIVNSGLLIWSFVNLASKGYELTLSSVVALVLFFTLGLLVRYALALFVVSPAFYAEKLGEGEDAYWSLQSLAKYPTGVFPRAMQFAFNFILPLTIMAAIPSAVFFGKENLMGSAKHFAVGLIFTALAFQFFKVSLRRYQSVNTGA